MEDDSRSGPINRPETLRLSEVSNKTPRKSKTTIASNDGMPVARSGKVMAKKARAGNRSATRPLGRTSGTSFLDNFKSEWALFWAGLLGDDSASALPPEVVETLSPSQIKEITKALSEQKKVLNQRLESLAKEIDLNATKLQSFKLAGTESPETEKRLNELTDLGQEITTEMAKLDERLRSVRGQERAAAKLAAAL